MSTNATYPIGTPGQPWGEPERAAWRARQLQQRSYADDVVQQITALAARYQRVQYGTIAHAQGDYALLALRSAEWDDRLPCVLVTGGVQH
ncbi:peptidase, partial [Xanthomonas vasicola pv. vasculorum NCPPB 895]